MCVYKQTRLRSGLGVFRSLRGSSKGWVKTEIQRLIASILNCFGNFLESLYVSKIVIYGQNGLPHHNPFKETIFRAILSMLAIFREDTFSL